MVLDFVAVRGSHLLLQGLDFVTDKFDNLAGFNVDHVVVMAAFVEFIIGLPAFEIVLDHQAGCLELVEHPVDSGQPDILPRLDEGTIDVVRGHVLLAQILKDIEDPLTRVRDLETDLLEILRFHLNIVSLRLARDTTSSPGQPPNTHMIIRFLTTALAAVLSLSACNLIYKQNVQQGNALEQEDLDELYIGMNRRQVLFVLGTPSVRDPFHQDRWDYVQTYSRRGGPPVQRTVTLLFENDALAEIIGAENPFDTPLEEAAALDGEDLEEIDPEDRAREEAFEKGQDVLDQGTDDDT